MHNLVPPFHLCLCLFGRHFILLLYCKSISGVIMPCFSSRAHRMPTLEYACAPLHISFNLFFFFYTYNPQLQTYTHTLALELADEQRDRCDMSHLNRNNGSSHLSVDRLSISLCVPALCISLSDSLWHVLYVSSSSSFRDQSIHLSVYL